MRYIDVQPTERESCEPVLLIHGHSSRLEEYRELIPHLARNRRVLVPDLPGSGYSEKPNRRYSLRFYEDSLLGFLDALQVKSCHVAGGSLGGNLVLRLGHREPGRFARLAAWAPAGVWKPKRLLARLGGVFSRLPYMFWASVWVQSRFWYRRDWPGREAALREQFAYYSEVYGPGFHRMYWEIAIDQIRQTLFDRAADIHHPTYLAVGDEDRALDIDRGVQRLAKLLPRAYLRVFKGARHALANEMPDVLGQEVDVFLSAHRA